ncbi:hypothetical protein [Mycolicibacterium pyrenivorans]|uniref:hypothetical protein n=1 Tax=Mycolicibacterium pyrenivorans TaxID=187102 RepID=UPI0021F27E6F|nr:hypothetical protein [Mycolicibacterium pyrenivorans]MCV7154583.1 hypothetical protein [Mycolicibacterium pyrenivorans]
MRPVLSLLPDDAVGEPCEPLNFVGKLRTRQGKNQEGAVGSGRRRFFRRHRRVAVAPNEQLAEVRERAPDQARQVAAFQKCAQDL